jgi:hypothetical protein
MEVLMSNKNSILLRTLGIILLVVLILAGGAGAFMAGQSRGYMLGANAAGNSPKALEPGARMPEGYGYPHMDRHFGFFPFGGLLGFLVMAALFCFALRLIFFPFRRRFFNGEGPNGHWHMHPHYHGPYNEEPPVEKPEKPADEDKA